MSTIVAKLFVAFMSLSFCAYSYLQDVNSLAALKISLPKQQEKLQRISEEVDHLAYKVKSFENPNHLLEIAQQDEFSSLTYPLPQDVVVCPSIDDNPPSENRPTYNDISPTIVGVR